MNSGAYPLYDFALREYDPVWGRWLTPDAAGLAAANLANPQTWNRYTYVGNDPLELTAATNCLRFEGKAGDHRSPLQNKQRAGLKPGATEEPSTGVKPGGTRSAR